MMSRALLLVGSSVLTAVTTGFTCLGVDKYKQPKIKEGATEEEIVAAIKKNEKEKKIIKTLATVAEATAISTGAMVIGNNISSSNESATDTCNSDSTVTDEAVEEAALMLSLY